MAGIRCGACKGTHPTTPEVKACWAEACYWGTCDHKTCQAAAYERHTQEAAWEAEAERAAERYFEEGDTAAQVRRIMEDDREASQF